MEAELAGVMAQFGAAGLVGWMWLSERRTAAVREGQVAEAHEKLMEQQTKVEMVVRAIEANTRALTSLEVGQGHLLRYLDNAARREWRQEGYRRGGGGSGGGGAGRGVGEGGSGHGVDQQELGGDAGAASRRGVSDRGDEAAP
ncbi:MAG: hypothetical protein C0468_07215 [Planctomyces sp.]|nr:hypothetical protein [Planctomyces sp.]